MCKKTQQIVVTAFAHYGEATVKIAGGITGAELSLR